MLDEDRVKDEEKTEELKPWYGFMWKRATFNNDHLSIFDKANVELVDTNGKGVSRLTETGVLANDKEYKVDLLLYSTGFKFKVESNFYQRTGIKVIGTKGRTLDEAWEKNGPCTLFGLHVPESPNLVIIGPCQAGVTAIWTHRSHVAGDHISEVVAACLEEGSFQAIEATEEDAEGWARQIEGDGGTRLQFAKACLLGYRNGEGKPGESPARWGFYPKGMMAWADAMRE